MDFSLDGDAWYLIQKEIVEIFPVFRFGIFSTETMLNFTGSLIEKSSKYLEFS